jgi:hypothetical protein
MPSASNVFLACMPLVPALYIFLSFDESRKDIRKQLVSSTLLSAGGFALAHTMIPYAMKKMPAILTGKDLCKKGTPLGDTPV